MNINELDIQFRTWNALNKFGIKDTAEVLGLGRNLHRIIPGLGRKSAKDLQRALSRHLWKEEDEGRGMIVREASDDDIRLVFGHVELTRAREMTASAWHDDPRILADEIVMLRDASSYRRRAQIFAHFPQSEIQPVAIVGVIPYGPGWGGMVWAAVPEWPRVSFGTHRWFQRVFVPEVLGRFRRVEFTSLAEDRISRAWLAGLGFTAEGIAYRQGKRGEDFVHYAWCNPDQTVGVVDRV